jgi:hypothetical protein
MPREIRVRLWVAAGIGGVLLLAMIAFRLMAADTPARVLAVDVCSLLRPQTVAMLVPEAGAPDRAVELRNAATSVSKCAYKGSRSELDVYVASFGRLDARSPAERAHASVVFEGVTAAPAKSRVPRIGDESWEYTFGSIETWVYARIGATVVKAMFESAETTQQSRQEAARTVVQEVISACGSAC